MSGFDERALRSILTSPRPPYYGEPPISLGREDLPEWTEFMHYLYLPALIPESRGNISLPPNLGFMRDLVVKAMADASQQDERFRSLDTLHVYVTARRGFASPGNPLNRPGWHCDDFGGNDLNYIWSDRFPTRFLLSEAPIPLSDDDVESMAQMTEWANLASYGVTHDGIVAEVVDSFPFHMFRLSPYVIHDTPIIPRPGGMRSFFKISVSTHRYNLLGNSRNYALDYDWPMVDRDTLRNQPAGGNKDYAEDTTGGMR